MNFDDHATTVPQRHGRRRALAILLLLLIVAGVVLFAALIRDGSTDPGAAPTYEPSPRPAQLQDAPKPSFAPPTPGPTPPAEPPRTFPESPRSTVPQPPTPSPDPLEGSISIAVTGDAVRELRPGTRAPLDVTFTNAQALPVTITGLEVRILSVTAPLATPDYACGVADYFVTPVPPGFAVTVPTGTTALSSLGTPQSRWPQVGMHSTSTDQRGCAEATIVVGYSATGRTS